MTYTYTTMRHLFCRLQQELNLKSTVSDVSLCSNVESRLTSAFSSERNSLVVDAFGIPIW